MLANTQQVITFAQICAYVSKITNVIPGMGTHALSHEPAMLWDGEGITFDAMRYSEALVLEINVHIDPLIRCALTGLCELAKLKWTKLALANEDDANLMAFGAKDGALQVPPGLEGSRDEIRLAAEELSRVLDAARMKAKSDPE